MREKKKTEKSHILTYWHFCFLWDCS